VSAATTADALPLSPASRATGAARQEAAAAQATIAPSQAAGDAATSRPVVATGPTVELQGRQATAGDALPGNTAAAPAAPSPVTAPAAPTAGSATSASAPQPQTLDAQLARPVFTLAAAGRGEHVMTVHVTPDTLGPVTVRAHVGADGVRVELFAPTDAGRDALRAILPDLRRDLVSTGLSGTLDLSSQSQPSPQQQAASDGRAAGQHGDGRPAADGRASGDDRAAPARTAADRGSDHVPHPAADGAIHSIDLIV
jgi:flagellar hook-length control protein FliK